MTVSDYGVHTLTRPDPSPSTTLKIVHVVGTRPNFIKLSPLFVALAASERIQQAVVHTGQHYDDNMSSVFFKDLDLPRPDIDLGVGSGSHAAQTAQIMLRLEPFLARFGPDWVVVVGDVNSTLAGALVAGKMGIPVAHVEAGLRSGNWSMPEEINRVLVDRLSGLLFCPTETARLNLQREGLTSGVHVVGDVMYDALNRFLPMAPSPDLLGETFGVHPLNYVLATVHRAANTDDAFRLSGVLNCLAAVDLPVVLPAHPRTLRAIRQLGVNLPCNVRMIEPVSYLAMLGLERDARAILTDSGGVQKEAFWLGVPCVTLREETEWTETIELGWNVLAGINPEQVRVALRRSRPRNAPPPIYGDGHASGRIATLLSRRA